MLEVHAAHNETQWLGMEEWLEDWETKWDERRQDNVQHGTGIVDSTVELLANT